VPAPTANAVQFAFAVQEGLAYGRQVSQRPAILDREAKKFWQLADQHRKRYSVHVTVSDRFGKKLGDEAQPRQACQNAYDPRDDCHRACDGNGASGISARQGSDNAKDDGCQR
jgi:hypothetical protein